jgi:hypothetical protein
MTSISSISELDDSLLLQASTEGFLVKARALRHLQKVLLRRKSMSYGRLFQRVGVGLTSKQFDGLVRVLVDSHFCIISVGDRGAVTITLNENFNNVPEAGDQNE